MVTYGLEMAKNKRPYSDEDIDRLTESLLWQIYRRDPKRLLRLIERMNLYDEKHAGDQIAVDASQDVGVELSP
jgi:hypothetical protein